ncbi:MAG TPA: thioesterase family protein [Gemmatimonadales bacterium]|nr:thioesterase family protein [Gemmatimonadales bacterium]
MTPVLSGSSEVSVRVNYSETDQMGVVYHARYLVWLDIARCEHLRRTGVTYADLERRGLRLAVGDLRIRYRQPARYDDVVRVRCWVRECVSRRVTFGYAVDCPERSSLLATAETSMMVLGADFSWGRLPPEVASLLGASPDPVRLF